MGRITIIPRLLTRDEAADYVGMSRGAFEHHCSVTPIEFGDKRLQRWDREDLDAWIDSRKMKTLPSSGVITEDEMNRSLQEWSG